MGHGAVSGPPSGSGPGALPLALGVKNGRVVLEVSDHRVAPGAVLRALQLEVPDVVFPVDMTGGPRAFQSRATVLRRLQLELDPARGHPAIRSRLELAGVDLQGVRLFGRRGLLQVSARVQRVPVVATFALTPDGGSGVRLTPGPAHAFGPLPRGTPPLFVLILQAVKAALASLRPHVEDAQMVCVPVAEAALWAVLPTAGWKLPANRRLPVHEVTVDRAGRVQVTVGAPEEAEDDLDSEGALPTMSVLARAAEAPAAIQDAYRRLEQGDPIAAFTGLRAHLDPATGPVSVVDTLLQIGVSDPRLHADAVDLAIDALSRAPGDPAGLLALAAMREDEHRDAARRESGQRYEAAARSFRATDDVLAAAYAHLAAARVLSPIDPGDAARHVNTALRLAPSDDLVQLASIDALTYEARLSEALATARQLAVHAGVVAQGRRRAGGGGAVRRAAARPRRCEASLRAGATRRSGV